MIHNKQPLLYRFPISETSATALCGTTGTTKLARSTSQYYFVLKSLHKILPSTTSYYKACTKYVPALLRTTKLAHNTPQYYFILQSLHRILRSTTSYCKACTSPNTMAQRVESFKHHGRGALTMGTTRAQHERKLDPSRKQSSPRRRRNALVRENTGFHSILTPRAWTKLSKQPFQCKMQTWVNKHNGAAHGICQRSPPHGAGNGDHSSAARRERKPDCAHKQHRRRRLLLLLLVRY